MKQTFLFISLLAFQLMFGQDKWSPYSSIEENVHLSDIHPSYNYSDFSTLAGNAGMRLGAFYKHNSTLSAEITLGVIGIGTPGTFSNTFIPVEAIGHYNLIKSPSQTLEVFNVDFGVGSGLGEIQQGRFAFSEHIIGGASMQIPRSFGFGETIIGFRYSYFQDDFIDGREAGVINDGILRFYTGFIFGGNNRKLKEQLKNAEVISTKLSQSLKSAEKENLNLKDQIDSNSEKFSIEKSELKAEIENLKESSFESNDNKEATLSEPIKGIAIVLGSFESKSLAEKYRNDIGEDSFIIEEPKINRYRVIYNVYSSMHEAKKESEILKEKYNNLWLVRY